MTIASKFKKDLNTLRSAVNGELYLDVKNPKLFKKVRKFYENQGVVFSGDPLDDYDILIDYIAEDLNAVEVAWLWKSLVNRPSWWNASLIAMCK